MRKTTLALSLALAGLRRLRRRAADKVTVQLKWLPQAQFAGYYVAAAKGFYKDAGLDVTIKPGGPDIAPAQVLAANGADVTVDWMPERAGRARSRRAAGQRRADLQPLGHDADLQEGQRRRPRRRTSRARRSASGSAATSTRSSTGWPSSA